MTSELFYLKKTGEAKHLRFNTNSNSETFKFGTTSLQVKDTSEDILLEIGKDGENKQNVLLQYLYYKSYQDILGQRSGAYIFRPSVADEEPQRYSGAYTYDGAKGTYVTQLRFYGPQTNHSITGNIYSDFIDIQTDLFGIPLGFVGQEVIMRFTFPDIQNEGVFYTDSMGLEMQERRVDYRPTWDFKSTQPVSQNYYPINHGVTIKDENMTLEILNDRSQGATSLKDGSIEFMIQRRTYKDDARGVGEALNEYRSPNKCGLSVTTHHYMRFYNNTDEHTFSQDSRALQRDLDVPVMAIFGTPTEGKTGDFVKNLLGDEIQYPDSLKAVYLPQEDGSIFARYENIMDLITFNETISIDVTSFAAKFATLINSEVDSITEVSNTGLYTIDEMKENKKRWKGADFTTGEIDYTSDLENISLEPQRIRSFVFSFKKPESLVSE